MDSIFMADSASMAIIDGFSGNWFLFIINLLIDQFKNNEFFSGGFLLVSISTLGYIIRNPLKGLYFRLIRRVKFTLFFDERDDFYIFFNRWLENNHKGKLRNAQIKTTEDSQLATDIPVSSDITSSKEEEEKKDKYYIIQKNDSFWIWYNGRPIYVEKNQEKLEQAKDISTILYNSYILSGYLSKNAMLNLIDNVMSYKNKKKSNNSFQVRISNYSDWRYAGENIGRSINSVIIDKEVKSNLIRDISEFQGLESWYYEKGISYSRGYLFYGLHGSGKSSLIKAIASYFNLNLHYLSITRNEMSDSCLLSLFSSIQKSKPLLVVEDIDTIFNGRENITKSGITFSGFLNCIDGLFSKSGLIIIFTTNHIEKLDPALIRPGRIDVRIELSLPTLESLEEYFNIFFNKPLNIVLNEKINISMAEIQNICIENKNDYLLAKKTIERLIYNKNEKQIIMA